MHRFVSSSKICWAEARVKIARVTLTIKLDGNWSNSAPPLSVTDSAIAPSARMDKRGECGKDWPSSGEIPLQHSCNVLDGVALAIWNLYVWK